MISMKQAVMQTITGRGRLFDQRETSPAFINYLDAYNAVHRKQKIFMGVGSFKEYGLRHDEKFTNSLLEDVSDNLVSVRWSVLYGFYGDVPVRRYGQWARMNKERLGCLNQLGPELVRDMVGYASGNKWELGLDGRSGFYIRQHHLATPNLIDVVHTNYDIAHNLGRMAMMHVT